MAIFWVDGAYVSASVITIPAHNPGDLIVIAAARQVNTIATKPSAGGDVPTWVDIDANAGASTTSLRVVRAFGTGTTTSGTWSDTNRLIVGIWRGVDPTTPIGGHAESGASGVSSIAPSITLSNSSGSSAIGQIHYHKNINLAGWDAAPSGYTRRLDSGVGPGLGMCINTKDVTTTDGSVTQGTGSSTGYRGATFELLAAAAAYDQSQFFMTP